MIEPAMHACDKTIGPGLSQWRRQTQAALTQGPAVWHTPGLQQLGGWPRQCSGIRQTLLPYSSDVSGLGSLLLRSCVWNQGR